MFILLLKLAKVEHVEYDEHMDEEFVREEAEDRFEKVEADSAEKEVSATIRKDFPESWIWDSIDGYGPIGC